MNKFIQRLYAFVADTQSFSPILVCSLCFYVTFVPSTHCPNRLARHTHTLYAKFYTVWLTYLNGLLDKF